MWLRVARLYWSLALFRFGSLGRQLGTGQIGQSMVEYAIVAALIAVVAMAAVQALGIGIVEVFQNILAKITGIGSG